MIKKLIISLLILLLLGGLATGCALGDQPEGWSGMAMVDNALFLGSMEGELVAIDVSSHNRLWSDVTLETTSTGTTFGCASGFWFMLAAIMVRFMLMLPIQVHYGGYIPARAIWVLSLADQW